MPTLDELAEQFKHQGEFCRSCANTRDADPHWLILAAIYESNSAICAALVGATEDVTSLDEQLDFHYFECPECGFSSVQRADFSGREDCPLCAGDSGHDVLMNRRVCRATDKAEGKDARALAAQKPGGG